MADGFYVLFATRFDFTLKIIQNVHMANDMAVLLYTIDSTKILNKCV